MKKICEAVEDILVTQGDLNKETAAKFRNLLLMKHRHQFEGPRKIDTGRVGSRLNFLDKFHLMA